MRLVLAALLAALSVAASPALAAPILSDADRSVLIAALAAGGMDMPERRDDASLWAETVRLATARLGLRVRPAAIDHQWAIAPRPRAVEAELTEAHGAGRLGAWLAALDPSDPRHRALEAARSRYAAIVRQDGWAPLPPGPAPEDGDTGPLVGALRARLAMEGYATTAAPAGPDSFDAPLRAALTAFQLHHGLEPDGILGPATRAALDAPAEQRLQQIDVNLERWRWLGPLPAARMEVDIAAAEATLHRPGSAPLTMRVVVGSPSTPTPMFVSRLEGVVLNPPWNVPATIASQELLPLEARRPGYLAQRGFTYVDGRLQQRPGPGNALGRVKFDLLSPFGVYLHDTSSPGAFARERRTLSHGCVRLEKPRELAAALLEGQGWPAARIDAAIDAGATQRIGLERPVPLYVLYWTALADEAGQVTFRSDVYGWDARLARALAAVSSGPVVVGSFDRPGTNQPCAAAAS